MSMSFPGADGLLKQEVASRLEETGRDGVEKERLRRKVEAGEEDLERVLAKLRAEGRAVEIDGRWFAPKNTDWTAGIVELLEEGDAMIRPGFREEPAFFVRKRNLKKALDGDTVLVRKLSGKVQPWSGRLPEAAVVQVLSNRFETLVGTLETSGKVRWLVSFDPKVSVELPVDGGDDVPDTHYVVVAVERPAPGRPPRGRVIEVLGDPEVPGVDVLVVLRHYGIQEEFPDAVLEAAARFPADPRPGDWAGREDLREWTIITIDGA